MKPDEPKIMQATVYDETSDNQPASKEQHHNKINLLQTNFERILERFDEGEFVKLV